MVLYTISSGIRLYPHRMILPAPHRKHLSALATTSVFESDMYPAWYSSVVLLFGNQLIESPARQPLAAETLELENPPVDRDQIKGIPYAVRRRRGSAYSLIEPKAAIPGCDADCGRTPLLLGAAHGPCLTQRVEQVMDGCLDIGSMCRRGGVVESQPARRVRAGQFFNGKMFHYSSVSIDGLRSIHRNTAHLRSSSFAFLVVTSFS